MATETNTGTGQITEPLIPVSTTGQKVSEMPQGAVTADTVLPAINGTANVRVKASDIAALVEVPEIDMTEIEESIGSSVTALRNELTPEIEAAKLALFIDQWNTACGIRGQYNAETGFFELNGLTDITYEQALDIMQAGAIDSYSCAGRFKGNATNIRTNLPRTVEANMAYLREGFHMQNFGYFSKAEVMTFHHRTNDTDFVYDNRSGIEYNYNLSDYSIYATNAKKILGVIDLQLCTTGYLNPLTGFRVEEVRIKNVSMNCNLSFCNSLNYESIKYLVDNAANTAPIIVCLGSDPYDSLVGNTTNPKVAQMSQAERDLWAQVLDDATAKDITFTR